MALRDQANSALAQHSHRGKSAAGAGPVQRRGSGRGDPGETVHGRGRNSGVFVPHAGDFAQSGAGRASRRAIRFGNEELAWQAKTAVIGKPGSTDWVVPVATVTLIFVMIVPVPAFLLDLLLATSITLGVIVLLSSLVHFEARANFPCFPTLIAVSHLVPDFAEHRQQPADSAARKRRADRGGQRHCFVRAIRGGRELRCRAS